MAYKVRPFRELLTRWFVGIVGVAAIPVLYIEVQRPWDHLDRLVDTSNAVLASLAAQVSPQDLGRMDRFTLAVMASEPPPEDERLVGVAFTLYVTGEPLPSPSALKAEIAARSSSLVLDCTETGCPDLDAAMAYWARAFAADPDPEATRKAFLNARVHFAQARDALDQVGLVVDDIYLSLDTGRSETGFFHDNIAFVLGALDWWDDVIYPGQAFDCTDPNGLFWRSTYLPALGGHPGRFSHNPTRDPVLPRFVADQWGTWFSVWYANEPIPGHFNSIGLDIDATDVRRIMTDVAATVLTGSLLAALSIYLAALYLARWVNRPVAALLNGAQAVTSHDYSHVVPAIGQGEFISLIETFNRMVSGLRERLNLMATLEKVLSPELAQAAARQGLVLGGEVANITILFTDFAGFSTITRFMNATEVVETLNAYFIELVPIIRKWGGFPDKYIGDAIVALFGAPVRFTNHAERAVRCAIEMQHQIRVINDRRRSEGRVVFEMRVGVNSGDVVVGAIGCDEKLEYTSIGESTNLANRMESACGIGHVMVADACFQQMRGVSIEGVRIDTPRTFEVKGYVEPVRGWPIHVSDLEIRKNPSAPDPADFYTYRRVDREGSEPGGSEGGHDHA